MHACDTVCRPFANASDHECAHNVVQPILRFMIISYRRPVFDEEKLNFMSMLFQMNGQGRIEPEEIISFLKFHVFTHQIFECFAVIV